MTQLFFAVMAALGLLASCDKDLDIQQAYSFSLETMPVPKRIGVGETAEIRCTLVREGEYADARYTIRYFQPDGTGELRIGDGTVFLPHDRYRLERFSYRLYYPSRSDDQRPSSLFGDPWDSGAKSFRSRRLDTGGKSIVSSDIFAPAKSGFSI